MINKHNWLQYAFLPPDATNPYMLGLVLKQNIGVGDFKQDRARNKITSNDLNLHLLSLKISAHSSLLNWLLIHMLYEPESAKGTLILFYYILF